MTRATFPLAILVALVIGFVARELVSTAQAQTTPPANAVCAIISLGARPDERAAAWMNEQIAAGRTRFVTFSATMCAW